MHEPLRSPVAFLASFLSDEPRPAQLVLVSGPSGAGKTRWCQELVAAARRAGLTPQGLISPAVFNAAKKVAIDLQEIVSGERHRLAVLRENRLEKLPAGLGTWNWQFDPQVLDWANARLAAIAQPDLLILDEIGPLELLENLALTQSLSLVDRRDYRLACVAIRPALVATALERWPWGRQLTLEAG